MPQGSTRSGSFIDFEKLVSTAASLTHDVVESDADNDPRSSEDLSAMVEAEPDKGAHDETEKGNGGRQRDLFFRAELVVNECGDVHAHEGNESAEVKKLSAALIGHQEGTHQSAQ